ncbi:MAG TPA: hypothetical protein VFB45_10335 [Pseudolabrys sp.]|nr:hypothetical protein [Pseudolabrys sp.]
MTRAFITLLLAAILAAPALARSTRTPQSGPDWQQQECLKGVAMIKSELKKNHPQEVRDHLQRMLERANVEVTENDWPECRQYIGEARQALQTR